MSLKSSVSQADCRIGKGQFANAKALTVLELIIGIAIIVVLVALLFPALNTIRNHSESARCVSNLRNYAVSANMYMSENNGLLPAPEVEGDIHKPWTRFLASYLTQKPLPYNGWPCPAHFRMSHAERSIPSSYGQWLWWIGYHTNRYFQNSTGVAGRNPRADPARRSQIKEPSRTVLFLDSDTRPSAGNVDAYAGYYGDGGGRWFYKIWPAHGRTFNIAFFDGHVEAVPFNQNGPNRGHSAADYPEFIWKPY